MIPLNRPLIYRSSSKRNMRSIDEILKLQFEDVDSDLVFSARQGLDIIYKNIYEEKGSCKVAVSPLTCFEA